ncbi:FAD-dependent oxidoreductase [Knoellia aerolata]|uniref:FAD-dependent oxidoreductase n=1 Tax=Knoellia aerolata TaxID=442954 RepID=UPI001FE023B0|nr:FAD-dependent oxidoreductase [Knoellia aerolata]
MEQQDLPGWVVIVGDGYVGLEQAQLWAHLGVHVTVIGRLASHAEAEVADVLRGVFADDGITVVEERAVAVERTGNGDVLVRTERGHELTGQRLLIATVRRANTEGLGLDAAGISTDDRGFITVDRYQATSNPRVFAAGDVSGAAQHVYVAAQTGRAPAAGALGQPTTVDYRGLPTVTFTTPQLASAGLTRGASAGRRVRLRLPRPKHAGRPTGPGQPRHPRCPQARRGRRHPQVLGVHPRSTEPGTQCSLRPTRSSTA